MIKEPTDALMLFSCLIVHSWIHSWIHSDSSDKVKLRFDRKTSLFREFGGGDWEMKRPLHKPAVGTEKEELPTCGRGDEAGYA